MIVGVLTVIGTLLPWWTIIDVYLGIERTVNFNPFFGVIESSVGITEATFLSHSVGMITLIGGS